MKSSLILVPHCVDFQDPSLLYMSRFELVYEVAFSTKISVSGWKTLQNYIENVTLQKLLRMFHLQNACLSYSLDMCLKVYEHDELKSYSEDNVFNFLF